jgi:hypothetical protein
MIFLDFSSCEVSYNRIKNGPVIVLLKAVSSYISKNNGENMFTRIALDQRCMSAELSAWLTHTVLLPVSSSVLILSSGTPVQSFS